MKTINKALAALLANQGLMASLNTQEGFKAVVKEIQKINGYKNPIGFAFTRDDEIQVLENDVYVTKTAQCSMSDINFNKKTGQNNGSAAIMHLALAASGVNVLKSKDEAVYKITSEVVKKALDLFAAYIQEANDDKNSHLNIQMLLDLEYIFEKAGDCMPIDTLGTTRNNYNIVFVYKDVEPKSVQSVYLKLYALSTGKAELRSLNLNGAFGLLTNVSWVDENGTRIPVSLDYLRENERMFKLQGTFPVIAYTDKFPTLQQHVILADNTRILDEKKVRMGAFLAAGTTVMPGAAYINFNAGTKGAVMVEGRISSSAIVGAGSDVGGGASILGVLSGTDGVPVTIGDNTLLGANSCTGTTIGDSCIIDAGVTILPGTKITLNKKAIKTIKKANPGAEIAALMKGMDFQELNGIHFRQDSTNGQIIAMRSTREVKLNADLH